MLASVSTTLDDQVLYGNLTERAYLGKFKAPIVSTNALGGKYLIDYDSTTQPLTENDTSKSNADEEKYQALDYLYERITQGVIYIDIIMVSAAHAGKSKGVDPYHLSKIRNIDLKTAERTLEVVSQNNKQINGPKLSRNYGTNYRML